MNVASRAAYRPAQRPASRLPGRGGGDGLTGYITINGELSGAVDEGDTLTLVFVNTSMLGIVSQAWDRDGVAFDPAETSLTYTDDNVQADAWHNKTAGITVTYSDGAIRRFTKQILINYGPIIITQPINQTVGVGEPATFTVEAEGFPAPTFQWQQFISG